jgi:hypothetical protein
MVATFTAQARAGEGEARSQGAAVRARCPFGFDLLAAAADDLLQVCLVRLSRVALARCLRAYACPSVGASLPYALLLLDSCQLELRCILQHASGMP